MFQLCKPSSGGIHNCMNYILQCHKWFRRDLVLIYRIHKFLKIDLMHVLITFHYDVRQDLIETTYGIVMYSSYHNCVFSLKMAYKAEKCC